MRKRKLSEERTVVILRHPRAIGNLGAKPALIENNTTESVRLAV